MVEGDALSIKEKHKNFMDTDRRALLAGVGKGRWRRVREEDACWGW